MTFASMQIWTVPVVYGGYFFEQSRNNDQFCYNMRYTYECKIHTYTNNEISRRGYFFLPDALQYVQKFFIQNGLNFTNRKSLSQ